MQQKFTLYYTVKENIKEDILNGLYPIGSLIPTENELEKQFNVSKITIRKAIELLEQDGYVQKKSGYGTTVISNSIYNKLSKGASFSNILQRQDLKLEKKHDKMQKIKLAKEDPMYQYFGTSAVTINRQYLLNNQPYIYMQHFIPKNVKVETIIDDTRFSIYMFLYRNHLVIDRFEDFFFVTKATETVAKALNMTKDTAILGRKRITYDENQQIIEVSVGYYNTDIHPYQINYHI